MIYSIDRFRGAIVLTVIALLFALTVVGCQKKDETMNAAPPPAAGAKAPPPSDFKRPARLPPLVGKGGGKAPMTDL